MADSSGNYSATGVSTPTTPGAKLGQVNRGSGSPVNNANVPSGCLIWIDRDTGKVWADITGSGTSRTWVALN